MIVWNFTFNFYSSEKLAKNEFNQLKSLDGIGTSMYYVITYKGKGDQKRATFVFFQY